MQRWKQMGWVLLMVLWFVVRIPYWIGSSLGYVLDELSKNTSDSKGSHSDYTNYDDHYDSGPDD